MEASRLASGRKTTEEGMSRGGWTKQRTSRCSCVRRKYGRKRLTAKQGRIRSAVDEAERSTSTDGPQGRREVTRKETP
ncbi:hypothetical protein R1flu_004593 [Riccia fluitans]|uniref:Uncharacterized protein n=1 Tax=Riccia fluitans TaxID=41844 RepID=A0ABD1YTN6_9MARC